MDQRTVSKVNWVVLSVVANSGLPSVNGNAVGFDGFCLHGWSLHFAQCRCLSEMGPPSEACHFSL